MRLNWGCGTVRPVSWVNVDREVLDGAIRSDATREPLPFPDETFEYAVANHSLNLVRWSDLGLVLGELRRVLLDEGVLRILVPDLGEGMRAYERGERDWFPTISERETTIDGRLCLWLTQNGLVPTVFTDWWLVELCERAGFRHARPVEYGITRSPYPGIVALDSRETESLIVEATR